MAKPVRIASQFHPDTLDCHILLGLEAKCSRLWSRCKSPPASMVVEALRMILKLAMDWAHCF